MASKHGKGKKKHLHTADYLDTIGVRHLKPATSPFDPGYDPVTVESHLEQSHHMMSLLKISMACWIIADEACTRRKPTRRPDLVVGHPR
jgi:phosphosulfolactate synthase